MTSRGLRLLVLSLWISSVAATSFAETSDCSLVEVPLDDHVKISFCNISADYLEAFQMGQFEVTQRQYRTLTADEPWMENGQPRGYVQVGDDNPAVFVSYNDAVQVARVLSIIDKSASYRLPSGEEWEFAARGGTATRYYWGDEFDENFVFFWDNVLDSVHGRNVHSCPHPVLNSRIPGYCGNGFGLMHMLGNVWEWTTDVPERSGTSPAAIGDNDPPRIVRGGSITNYARGIGYHNRFTLDPNLRWFYTGFRLVRVPKQ